LFEIYNDNFVDTFREKLLLLREAHKNFVPDNDFQNFCLENIWWLDDYSLFMALQSEFNTSWDNWPDEIKTRKLHSLEYYHLIYIREVNFYKFLQ
jgi:4-alpha-glucanotransferase